MELLEIKSAQDLTAQAPEKRRTGPHSYLVSCRQFMFVLGKWRKADSTRGPTGGRGPTMSFMSLAAEQIWITENEIAQVSAAIQSAYSPLALA
jgi:hypothetical protein